ncbi:MAG: hypothetical protein L0099_08485 [Acidobacteria bacterium]|nr:hypothetical protein [Acidobacteriota bacterium]
MRTLYRSILRAGLRWPRLLLLASWLGVLPPLSGGGRSRLSLTTSVEVALVAATAKTVLQLRSPTNQRVSVSEITVSFDGISNTAEPVLIRVLVQTTGGTMTARNPVHLDRDIATAIQSTGGENASVEPTDSDILITHNIHPQAGVIHQVPIPDGEIVLGGADFLGIKITAPAAVNCVAGMRGEE